MKDSLTVFFCGTGSNQYDISNESYWNGELVSTLAYNMESREYADWIIVDGPGSGNLQLDQLWTEKVEHSDILGKLIGNGWEENINHAINIVKRKVDWQRKKLSEDEYNILVTSGIPLGEPSNVGSFFWRNYDYGDRKVTPQQLQEQIIKIFRKNQLPSVVNLVGWSRGGISCIMLANKMLNDDATKDIPINICVFDPVPGMGNFQRERVSLGTNVKNYVGFYAEDERSKGFINVVPKTAPSTSVTIITVPGRHATLVGNAALDGANGEQELKQVGIVVRDMAEKLLADWGVELKNKLSLSGDKIKELIKEVQNDSRKYSAMHDYSYTFLTEDNGGERIVSYGDKSKTYEKIEDDGVVFMKVF